MVNKDFYRGKRVFVTGHTGFKGAWLCKILTYFGAQVCGYALTPPTDPNLFDLSGVEKDIVSVIGDVRDFQKLLETFHSFQPEIVFHLAAQPIVRESYRDPMGTYESNVMGTVNVLECIRRTESVKSFLNVTTDKVYLNNDSPDHAFREDEPLDGFDPYSNSKSCSELVTHSYKKSFFGDGRCAISTARAGNVIGGGDFAIDRIIPDCVRAAERHQEIIVRNPYSMRPYQHVLEPLFVYLEIAEKQFADRAYEGYYNVGPDDCDCVNTAELVTMFCMQWGDGVTWKSQADGGPHEATFLKLDNSKIKTVFDWHPRWHIGEAVERVVAWSKNYLRHKSDVCVEMKKQIEEYLGENG